MGGQQITNPHEREAVTNFDHRIPQIMFAALDVVFFIILMQEISSNVSNYVFMCALPFGIRMQVPFFRS